MGIRQLYHTPYIGKLSLVQIFSKIPFPLQKNFLQFINNGNRVVCRKRVRTNTLFNRLYIQHLCTASEVGCIALPTESEFLQLIQKFHLQFVSEAVQERIYVPASTLVSLTCGGGYTSQLVCLLLLTCGRGYRSQQVCLFL